jgi:hypothetical protein
MKSEKQDMRELTVGEKALRQTVLRGAAWNVIWAFLIGGAATAAIFMFTSGWVKWALFIPVMLWVFGCIKEGDERCLMASRAGSVEGIHRSRVKRYARVKTKNAVSFSFACTKKRFPLSQCASANSLRINSGQ